MSTTLKIDVNKIVVISLIVVVIIIASIIERVDPLFAAIMIIWICLFFYSIFEIRNAPLLFCFLSSFFVFLLGRQFCYHYLHINQVYEYLDETNNETYNCIILSLIGFSAGLFLLSKIKIKSDVRLANLGNGQKSFQIATKYLYYICYFGTLIATLMQIRFVQRVGYLESYTEEIGGAGIPTIIIYLSKCTPVALCLYLATRPTKKNTIISLLFYETYALLSLLTGQRFPFIGNSMLIFVYLVLRNKQEAGWIKKSHFIVLIISIPILIVFMTAYDSIRLGKSFSLNSISDAVKSFLIQQGGSVNVIRRTLYNANQLNDIKLVSFHSTYSALFENGIVRRMFNIKIYSGNSIERALNTNSLAHRLSYLAYGNDYLLGRGTGSSYIAELLHDFGWIGIFFGSSIYGIIVKRIDEIDFQHTFGDGIKLAMIYHLLFAPRGEFDSFIGNVFNLQTIIGFICVWTISTALKNCGIKKIIQE